HPAPGCPARGSRGRLEPAAFRGGDGCLPGRAEKDRLRPLAAMGAEGLPGRALPAVPRAARGGMALVPGGIATVATILKRCDCDDNQWKTCPHPWVVRYRTTGGRSSRQREQSFGGDLREAENFALKVEHDKRAHVFIDPKAGHALFKTEAETWLDRHLGADSSIATYPSVLRAHVCPAIGGKPIGSIRLEDIKALIAS